MITIDYTSLIFTILWLDYAIMPKIYTSPHQHLQNDGSDGSEIFHSYSIRFEGPNHIQLRNLIWHWKLLFKLHKIKSYVVPILFRKLKRSQSFWNLNLIILKFSILGVSGKYNFDVGFMGSCKVYYKDCLPKYIPILFVTILIDFFV